MNTEDKFNMYTLTQSQLDETIELLTTSLRHIPPFSMQLRADMRENISVLKKLALTGNEYTYAGTPLMHVIS